MLRFNKMQKFPNIGSKAFSEHWQVLDYDHAASPESPKCGGVLCGWSNSCTAPTRSSETAGVLSEISCRVKLCQQLFVIYYFLLERSVGLHIFLSSSTLLVHSVVVIISLIAK